MSTPKIRKPRKPRAPKTKTPPVEAPPVEAPVVATEPAGRVGLMVLRRRWQ